MAQQTARSVVKRKRSFGAPRASLFNRLIVNERGAREDIEKIRVVFKEAGLGDVAIRQCLKYCPRNERASWLLHLVNLRIPPRQMRFLLGKYGDSVGLRYVVSNWGVLRTIELATKFSKPELDVLSRRTDEVSAFFKKYQDHSIEALRDLLKLHYRPQFVLRKSRKFGN